MVCRGTTTTSRRPPPTQVIQLSREGRPAKCHAPDCPAWPLEQWPQVDRGNGTAAFIALSLV